MENDFYLPMVMHELFLKHTSVNAKEMIQMKYNYARRVMSYE